MCSTGRAHQGLDPLDESMNLIRPKASNMSRELRNYMNTDFCWTSQGPTLSGKNEEKAQVLTEKIEALVVQVWLHHVYAGSMNLSFYVKAVLHCLVTASFSKLEFFVNQKV